MKKYQVALNGYHVGYVRARSHEEAHSAASIKFNASPECELDIVEANI